MIGAIATIIVSLLFIGACVFYIVNTARNGRIETDALAGRIELAVLLHNAQQRAAPPSPAVGDGKEEG